MNIKFGPGYADFLKDNGTAITTDMGDTWYHYPFWVKDLGNDTYQIVSYDHIPADLEKEILSMRKPNVNQ